ncbi:hypothetical protein SB781_39850, partial [Paraburkholderia sp. SIMBA_061]
YHVYLFLDGTTPDVELSTTSPAAPYWGTARTKAGDTSRRYIGSFRTGSTGAVVQFQHQSDANIITWLGADYTLRNVLSA